MDGMTDFAFRQIHAIKGRPDVCFTEFTHVEGMWHGNTTLLDNFLYHHSQRPIIAQIYGKKPEYFYKAAIMVCAMGFDGIDINMGCPAKNVTHSGGGAALIDNPQLAKQIIQAVQQGIQDWTNGITLEEIDTPPNKIAKIAQIHTFSTNKDVIKLLTTTHHRFWSEEEIDHILTTSNKTHPLKVERLPIPVSVKTRIGITKPQIEEWIPRLLETNLANITLHGRTLKQMYTGQADYHELNKAATLVTKTNTTLMINGDITSPTDALEKISLTKAHGALIGRAALGNPWIWQPGHQYTPVHRLQDALEHARLFAMVNHNPNQYVHMRKHFNYYIRDFPYANEIKTELVRSSNLQESEKIIKNALSKIT
jgi:tRNA-dihydrouridine synthase